jgi:hypothetical protein
VASHLSAAGPELRYWLKGKNPICDYLVQNVIREAETYAAGKPWSRVVWDVAPVAWAFDSDCAKSRIEAAIVPDYNCVYEKGRSGAPFRYVYHIDRDAVFGGLFARLAKLEKF